MSLEVTGKLHEVFETQQIKENFSKREFVLELTDESPSGMVFTNYAAFQLINNQTTVIDQFQLGEQVKVSFNIRGNRWEKDGQVRYITNLNAWRVERGSVGNQQAAPQNQNYAQTGGFNQSQPQQQAPQQQAPPQQTGGFPPNNPDDGTDLPF